MKKFLFFMAAFIFLCSFALADIHIKTKTHTDAVTVMGQSQPERNEVIETWIGQDRYANHSSDMSMIVDLKKNLLYLLDHKEKTYVEASLPLDISKLLPPEMSQMMSMMQMSVSVNPTNQTKTIGSWKCQGYEVSISMMMMPMKMMVWATTDVPFDTNQFMEKFQAPLLKLQMRLDGNSLAEFFKIKGYWISSEVTGVVMGAKIHSTSEVIEISKATPPPTAYSIPANYKKTERLRLR